VRALPDPAFVALLARARSTKSGFARLNDLPARDVDNWMRGHAHVPQWVALLAISLQDFSPEALTISLDEAEFS
jgi:hypothetical protein